VQIYQELQSDAAAEIVPPLRMCLTTLSTSSKNNCAVFVCGIVLKFSSESTQKRRDRGVKQHHLAVVKSYG
jgi:hypothetical protein